MPSKALARQLEPDEDRRRGQGTLYSVEEIGALLAGYPRYWGTVINGDCMDPDYKHGEVVVVDKEAWPERGMDAW